MKPVRYAGLLAALACLAGFVVLTVTRLLTPEQRLFVLAASFVPYALPACLLAVVVLLLVRMGASTRLRRTANVLLAIGVAGAVLHATWLAPSYAGTGGTGPADLTVVSLNLRFGQADPDAVAALVRRERPDLVVLQEAGPTAVAALASRGVGGPGSRWPHQAGWPIEGISGTVVLSALPLGEQERLDLDTGAYAIPVEGPEPFTLMALHTTQPLYSSRGWLRDFAVLQRAAASARGPRMMVGDFNATLDHGPMRDLLDTGLEDAARQANAGWQPTWPSSRAREIVGVPAPFPLMAIDHVLLSEEFAAISSTTRRVRGTDHLAVVVRIARDQGF